MCSQPKGTRLDSRRKRVVTQPRAGLDSPLCPHCRERKRREPGPPTARRRREIDRMQRRWFSVPVVKSPRRRIDTLNLGALSPEGKPPRASLPKSTDSTASSSTYLPPKQYYSVVLPTTDCRLGDTTPLIYSDGISAMRHRGVFLQLRSILSTIGVNGTLREPTLEVTFRFL